MTDQLQSDIQDLHNELNQLSQTNPGVDVSAAIAKVRSLEQTAQGLGDSQQQDAPAPDQPVGQPVGDPSQPTADPAPLPDEPADQPPADPTQPPANPSQPGVDPSQPNPPAAG